ncbi:MAG: hypothetical protein AVDCRST_MAG87-3812 [uncultured Thermomicrobiales bacterium]|uniref:Uncharacterized protein n=1 Tax=uncultured Thermomicrobiales bacterium TaxID=1645740 RepID=A0A6J4VNX6_9BACT|nr:MAG: hypothetical protein AVDCRST_MAG87-3812 [uncultured Thermomicrobiales bacterium]
MPDARPQGSIAAWEDGWYGIRPQCRSSRSRPPDQGLPRGIMAHRNVNQTTGARDRGRHGRAFARHLAAADHGRRSAARLVAQEAAPQA